MKEPAQADKATVWGGGRTLYHMTPRENLESILKTGLLPAHGNFVCLCEDPLSWYQDYTRLAVDLDAFRGDNPGVRVTTWLPDLDEVCVWGAIPPKYIRLCDRDVEDREASHESAARRLLARQHGVAAVRPARGSFPQGKGGKKVR